MAGCLQHYLGLMNGLNKYNELNNTDNRPKHTDLEEEVGVISVGDDKKESLNHMSLTNDGNFDLNKPPETVKPDYTTERVASDNDTHTCQKCLRQFNTKEKLNDHSDMHILYGDNECFLCHKVFTLARNLKRHLACIHSIDTVTYYCLACPKIFNHAEKLALHKKKCKLDKPVCYLCSQELKSFQDLREHQEYEHSLRGFLCGFCAVSLPTAKELTAHVEFCSRKKSKVGEGSLTQNKEASSDLVMESPECVKKTLGTKICKSQSTSKLKPKSIKRKISEVENSKVNENGGYGHVLKSIMNFH